MAFVLSSVSGNLISAASAGYAPTNSADVSAIASAYQVVSATGVKYHTGIGQDCITTINGKYIWSEDSNRASTAYYDVNSRLLEDLPGSAEVSSIASSYALSAASGKLDTTAQVVTATATQLYAGTAFLTGINGAPVSASRAGNAANASLANSAWYDGTGRFISALPDSAAVSAIASAYAESAASSKQDTLAFAYNTADQISSINGSALGGMDEAAVSGIASAYAESAASSKLDASASSSFYSTANESGFITGVDLSPYQTTADMSSYIPTSMSSDFQPVTGMSSYVPYSSIGYNTASAISGINGSALAGTTYSAGTGIDITDDVISVEAPVDIVAGPGIVIDNPDGNTLRVSTDANYETVLWEGTVSQEACSAFTLSEYASNFERIRFYGSSYANTPVMYECPAPNGTAMPLSVTYVYFCASSDSNPSQCRQSNYTTTDGLLFNASKHRFVYGNDARYSGGNTTNGAPIYKIVGIHRIAGGN